MSDHPVITAYLHQLATASRHGPPDRRQALLDDVAAHLREIVPPNASEDHAHRLLASFGEPEALANEAFGAQDVPARRPPGPWMVLGLVAATLATVAVATTTMGLWPTASREPSDGPAAEAQDTTVPTTSVVRLHPTGPERTTQGRAHIEYVRAVETLPSLPPGAQYPEGVPAPPETAEPVMVETGTGAVIAAFTWLCAWESEYLQAHDARAHDRVLIAEDALRTWVTIAPTDPESLEGWIRNVLAPLDFDDASGVRDDRPAACAQAGIVNLDQ